MGHGPRDRITVLETFGCDVCGAWRWVRLEVKDGCLVALVAVRIDEETLASTDYMGWDLAAALTDEERASASEPAVLRRGLLRVQDDIDAHRDDHGPRFDTRRGAEGGAARPEGRDVAGDGSEREMMALFAKAEAACRVWCSAEQYEPAFVRLLEYIAAHPMLSAAAERTFIEGVESGTLCDELVAFCMHSLRMPRVADTAQNLARAANPRAWGPLSSILSAFDDDWSEADMYEYYRRRSGTKPCR